MDLALCDGSGRPAGSAERLSCLSCHASCASFLLDSTRIYLEIEFSTMPIFNTIIFFINDIQL